MSISHCSEQKESCYELGHVAVIVHSYSKQGSSLSTFRERAEKCTCLFPYKFKIYAYSKMFCAPGFTAFAVQTKPQDMVNLGSKSAQQIFTSRI